MGAAAEVRVSPGVEGEPADDGTALERVAEGVRLGSLL